jgi:hypothetical protein
MRAKWAWKDTKRAAKVSSLAIITAGDMIHQIGVDGSPKWVLGSPKRAAAKRS